jgi:putative ABC transport system permease protein
VSQDVRFAIRSLLKYKGFTLAVVIILALTIAANGAIFSVISAVLLRPLPYFEPDQLTQIWETDEQRGLNHAIVSPANYLDWKDRSQAFQALAAWRFWFFNLAGSDEPERVQGLAVSTNFFELLGVRPSLGRNFSRTEEEPGHEKVVILSHSLWKRRFGSNSRIIGSRIRMEGEPFEVIGIMPPDFKMIRVLNRDLDEDHSINVFGRLKPEVTLQFAQAEMNTIAKQLQHEYPKTNLNRGILVVRLQENYSANIRPTLLLLMVAIGFVALIAGSNVTNLLLTRSIRRQKEIAIRMAIGAGRLQVLRLLITESMILALLGGFGGLIIAYGAIDLLNTWIPSSMVQRLQPFQLDPAVLL